MIIHEEIFSYIELLTFISFLRFVCGVCVCVCLFKFVAVFLWEGGVCHIVCILDGVAG